jgi:hypothetical protein
VETLQERTQRLQCELQERGHADGLIVGLISDVWWLMRRVYEAGRGHGDGGLR